MKDRLSLGEEELVAMASLKEIVGGFIHEIAQPLNAIMIASQVIQMKLQRGQAPDEEKAYSVDRLKVIGSQVQRANEILDSLRGFARGGSSQAVRVADLATSVQVVKGLMSQQFISRGIELTLEGMEHACAVGADPNLVLGVMVMALAFVRDKVQLIGERHAADDRKHKKSAQVCLMRGEGVSSVRMTWDPGDVPSGEDPPEPRSLVGLLAARTLITGAGGTIEHGKSSLVITFPGATTSGT